ncbi:MAG: transposase [Acidimicrobiia bacterium]|nr:transposase [Acidimicrobiia bacterium]
MKLLWRDTTPHGRVAKQRIRRLRQLDTEIKQLTAQIKTMVDQSGTRMLDIRGVGVLVAATILSEVGDPHRYATKAKFAMANGTAPLEASSGRVVRHRLNHSYL